MSLAKGFEKKSFLTVRSEIEDALTDALGEVNLVAPSVFANIIAVFAERESQLWDMLEAVYNSAYPDTAEGYSLDAVCALNGITRLSATYSTAVAQITGINYTKIAKDTKVAVKSSGDVFLLEKDLTVTNDKCYSIKLEIINANSAEYKLSINGQTLTYIKEPEDTKEQIAAGLTLLINNNMTSIVTATNDSTNIFITTKYINTSFSCYINIETMLIVEVTNNATFIAEESGYIPVPTNSLNEIKTPVSGFLSINNISSGNAGTDTESDIALRSRRKNSLSVSGSGTLEAIKSAILNIEGVTSVSIYENNADVTDANDIPAHSFKILVTGGDDNLIANAIWQKKPAGIGSFGNVTVAIKDSNEQEHNISFSRSTKRYVFVKVTITKNITFIDESVTVIQANIAAQINKLGAGNNVILNSLYCSVFEQVGIKAADIVIGSSLDESPVPELSNSDVSVAAEEVAFSDSGKIEVILQE